MENVMSEIFGEMISTYSRAEAIEDGVLVDMNKGHFDEVTKGIYSIPVAVTSAVFAIIKRAAENPRTCNDWKGIWHDMVHMSRVYMDKKASSFLFPCTITGAGRVRKFYFKSVIGGGDNGEPVITFMLPNED